LRQAAAMGEAGIRKIIHIDMDAFYASPKGELKSSSAGRSAGSRPAR
jgi:hypothetical protein